MKYIKKCNEPAALIHFKNLATLSWTPSFTNLDRPTKDTLREALLTEQGFLCCYCEAEVEDDNSHIEHFIPQSRGTVDSLDYGNLLLSCLKNTSRGAPRHCGKRKDHDPGCAYHPNLLLNPTDPGCEQFFGYKGDGRIFPENTLNAPQRKKAEYTIKALGLDIKKLRRERRTTINAILDQAQGLSRRRQKRLIKKLLREPRQPEHRRYPPHFTTIRYLF